MLPEGSPRHLRPIPPGQIEIGPSRIDGYQDQDNEIPDEASIPLQWGELAAALRGEQRRRGSGRNETSHATAGNHGNRTKSDPAAQAGAVADAGPRRTRCACAQSRTGARTTTRADRCPTGRAAGRDRSVRHHHGGA
jgi:hypothetical protein